MTAVGGGYLHRVCVRGVCERGVIGCVRVWRGHVEMGRGVASDG